MDNASKIDGFLKEISQKLGTKFALINRVCVLVDRDKSTRWIVEVPENSDFVVFFAPLFVIPEYKRREGYHVVLNRNIYANENRGTWLALNPNSTELTLVFSHVIEMLSCQLFENILTQFVEFSKEVRTSVYDEIMNEAADSSMDEEVSAVDRPDFSRLA